METSWCSESSEGPLPKSNESKRNPSMSVKALLPARDGGISTGRTRMRSSIDTRRSSVPTSRGLSMSPAQPRANWTTSEKESFRNSQIPKCSNSSFKMSTARSRSTWIPRLCMRNSLPSGTTPRNRNHWRTLNKKLKKEKLKISNGTCSTTEVRSTKITHQRSLITPCSGKTTTQPTCRVLPRQRIKGRKNLK